MTPQNRAIYQAFIDDPNLHLRTDLGPHYRCGALNIRRPTDPKHEAAWRAGRDFAKRALPPSTDGRG